jgi:hypothetical protein
MSCEIVHIGAEDFYNALVKFMGDEIIGNDSVDEFDETLGLEIIGEDTDSYMYKVIDSKKWMLGKLKWGL